MTRTKLTCTSRLGPSLKSAELTLNPTWILVDAIKMADLVLEGIDAVAEMLMIELNEYKNRVKRRKRKIWTREWILRRSLQGASENFLREVEFEDHDTYKNHLRLTRLQFEQLLELISTKIQKQNTTMRAALPARIKLQITLRYLATGDCFRTLECLYRVPKSTISKFIPTVLDAIYEALEEFIQVPKTKEEWEAVEKGFQNEWDFPGCYGALDGKHVNIQQPSHSGSEYFNYKSHFSTVLLALVDSKYCFTFIDVGGQGRVNDSNIFNDSSLKVILEKKMLGFPAHGVIVGDEGFPLKDYLMKPFSRRLKLTHGEKIFNYRLSRARRVSENAFGIMAMKFRIFRTAIYLCPEKVDKIVKSTCALHNWLIKTSPSLYMPTGTADIEGEDGVIRSGSWRLDLQESRLARLPTQQGSNRYSAYAERRRQKYVQYFLRDGAVYWQNEMII